MAAVITSNIRVFNANQFINSFTKKNYDQWQTATPYVVGDLRINSFYLYIAISSNTSGAIAPTHTSGTVSDGGVDWLFVDTITNTSFFENNLYIAIGKVLSWDNPGIGDETPITPVDNFSTEYSNLSKILAMKRIESNDVAFAIVRYDWTSGTVYNQFDPTIESFDYSAVNSGSPFYVLTDENKIYKCLNNNGDIPSTSKPTSTSNTQFQTGDGYVWKYMATVDASDAIQFLTDLYVPVRRKLVNDASPQWNTQENAKSGSISTINVTNGGTGYTTATVTIDPPVSGVTATATAIIQSGVVTAIRLTNVGEGYFDIPSVTITGDGTSATADAVLAPKDGHGNDILTELNARHIVVNSRFDDTEGGYFPITGENDFRQILIVVDPINEDTSLVATETRLIGPDHDDYALNPNTQARYKVGSGSLLLTENISPVIRTSGQIEDVKIVLKF